MHSRRIAIALAACCLLPLSAAPAGAASDDLYDEYLTKGFIPGCKHSEAELQAGLTSVPADIQAYDPGFSQALSGALDIRASGCGGVSVTIPPAGGRGTAIARDGSPGPSPENAGLLLRPLPEGSATSDFPIEAIYLGLLVLAFAGVLILWPGRRGDSGAS